MATEKILNTRIKLRYDTYDAWHLANPTLLKGEVAIVELPSNPTNTDHGVNPPATLIKVGPGSFNSLPFLSATAADVHAWAKKTEDQFKAWVKGLIPADVTDEESGKFIVGMTMTNDANGIHAVISRADVTWTDIKNKPDLATKDQGDLADSALQSVKVLGKELTKTANEITVAEAKTALGLGSAAYTDSTAYATATQGEAADKAAAKLAGIDDGKTVVDYVTDAIEGVTGGDITVDTAKNYDTTTGNIKTKFEAVEKAITDGIAEAKKYADDNDANDNTEYHIEYDSTGKKIKLVAGADSSKMEIDATPFIKDGMLKDVAYDADTNTLTFTWNTDGEVQTDTVVLSDILDPYTTEQNAGSVQLTINGTEISAELVSGGIQSHHFATEERDVYDLSQKLVEDLNREKYLDTSASTVSASLKKADSAVQPVDLGTMAKEAAADYVKKADATGYNDILTKTDAKAAYVKDATTGLEITTNTSGEKVVGIMAEGVGTSQIAGNAVTEAKLDSKAVTTAKIADHAVGAAQIKAEQGYAGADAEVWVFDCGGAL